MKRTVVFVALALLGGCPACDPPVLNGLTPSSGPPGTVVEVSGQHLSFASVLWDVPPEGTIPSGPFSATYFSVPHDAKPGPHDVRLQRRTDYSGSKVFTVKRGVARPAPRIDDITYGLFDIDDDGKANFFLFVFGANFDVGATIHIDGNPVTTWFHSLLRNTGGMNATKPATLGYPIFHYATVVAWVEGVTPGTNINVKVENLGKNNMSLSRNHAVPGSVAELDSDGDGLLDEWEEKGYDKDGDGTVDLDLAALGAHKHRKDLFVEVDWMAGAQPPNAMWTPIVDAFANAPLFNPDGTFGITIHIDRGGASGTGGNQVAYTEEIAFDVTTNSGLVDFHDVKRATIAGVANFDSVRLLIYRYCIFGWKSGEEIGESGRYEGDSLKANDFYVTLASKPSATTNQYIGTFMHELGHTLGLTHGGSPQDTFQERKPNYNSVMTYGRLSSDGETTLVASPSQFYGIDIDCDMANADYVYTYSQGQRATLDEASIDEALGVCDKTPVDFDFNGSSTSVLTNFELDGIADTKSQMKDYGCWRTIQLRFRGESFESQWGND